MRVGRSERIGRLRGGVGDPAAYRLQDGERAPGARCVRAVGEQHDEEVAIRIDPERRPGPAGVAEAPRPKPRPGARYRFTRGQRLPAERTRLRTVPEIRRLAREKRSEEHTSELQSQSNLVCRLLLEKKKKEKKSNQTITMTTH